MCDQVERWYVNVLDEVGHTFLYSALPAIHLDLGAQRCPLYRGVLDDRLIFISWIHQHAWLFAAAIVSPAFDLKTCPS